MSRRMRVSLRAPSTSGGATRGASTRMARKSNRREVDSEAVNMDLCTYYCALFYHIRIYLSYFKYPRLLSRSLLLDFLHVVVPLFVD